MNTQTGLKTFLGLATGALVVSVVAVAQQGDRKRANQQDQTKQAEPAPEMNEAMEAWMQYSEPDEHHKLMEPTIGTFTTVSKMWMDPTVSEPMISSGTMKAEWVLGGRFVKQHFKGEFMGQPFEGIGMWGFDRYKEMYTGYWWDTFGTTTYESRGTVNEAGDTFTMYGIMQDPAQDGRLVQTRDVTRIISDDKHVMEMYHDLPDGSWMKVMEITFMRSSSNY